MRLDRTIVIVMLAAILNACGEPTVIDVVKDSYVSECEGATVGDMLVGYFPTTTWTAVAGDAAGTYEITGEGQLQFVGSTQTATMRFSLNEESGEVAFEGASLAGREQVGAMANQLLRTMCTDATG